ncbi:MAG: hypothetical protein HRU17_05310 [Polyangiaceae bacterium]|nr:hypothetical protein [Polyangiaceae bacterium]
MTTTSAPRKIPFFRMRMFRSLVALSVALAGTACAPRSPWLLVRSQASHTSEQSSPEVTETPRYLELLPRIRSIAVQAPDYCANRSAVASTGAARSAGTVLSTNCGVAMGELERAFVKAGYRVISWRALRSMVDSTQVTPSVAAQKLGAEILFQINSLQKVKVQPRVQYRWDRQFLGMDKHGRRLNGEGVLLSEQEGADLISMISPHEIEMGRATRLGAALDAVAMTADSGEALWFYRWTMFEPVDETRTVEVQAVKGKRGWEKRHVIYPRSPGAEGGPQQHESASLAARAGNREDQKYYGLMQQVVQNFVKSFSANGAAGASAPRVTPAAAGPPSPAVAVPAAPASPASPVPEAQ